MWERADWDQAFGIRPIPEIIRGSSRSYNLNQQCGRGRTGTKRSGYDRFQKSFAAQAAPTILMSNVGAASAANKGIAVYRSRSEFRQSPRPGTSRSRPHCPDSGHALNALFDQPACEVRVIRGSLAADANIFSLLKTGFDSHRQHHQYSLIAFIKQLGNQR